jgi:YidC/Oxa1 family membrane protein insertase
MLDGLFELISNTLNFFYELIPNYAIAIALLTCVVMLITTPLTLKGTRSMIEMQRLQPQIRRLQVQYKDDRQKLNEELMAFYKEHEINPVGGCLPLIIQAPVFSILFYVVRGLTAPAKFVSVQKMLGTYDLNPPTVVTEGFRPKYLHHSTELYQSLVGQTEMNAFGVDLALSPAMAVSKGFVTALPYILLVAVIAVLSWFQQKQIMGRNPNAEVTQQQQLMMRIGPLLYVFFAFISPAAIGVYFLVSTLWRVGQQAFITRSLYRGEDSVGVQAQKAMAELRAAKKNGDSSKPAAKGGAATGRKAPTVRDATPKDATPKDAPSGNGVSRSRGRGNPAGRPTAASGARSSSSGARPHPRSRKKKKRK